MWSDNETDRDFLNFRYVADIAAEMIAQAGGRPLSMGISGSWGVGKSSMMRLLSASLRERTDAKFLFVEFNAWLYQGYDDTRAALMEVIAQALVQHAESEGANEPAEERRTLLKGALERAKGLAARVNWFRLASVGATSAASLALGLPPVGLIGEGIRIAGHLAAGAVTQADVDDATKAAKEIATGAKDVLKENKPAAATSPPAPPSPPKAIHEFREDLKATLTELGVTLVVLIDDLDRCLPSTAISTLEAMRLFLFLNRTAFVIAADDKMIRAAVRAHFKDVALDDDLVTNYFDKLVQVPIRVPPLGTQDVRAYLMLLFIENSDLAVTDKDRLRREICARLGQTWSGKRVDRAFVSGLIQNCPDALASQLDLADRIAPLLTSASQIAGNPRLIKRFLNTLSIRLSIAKAVGVTVDEAALAKMLLFERCGSEKAYAQLLTAINEDDEGKPRFLQPWEAAAAENPAAVELEGDWNSPFTREWLTLQPNLADLDLRGVAYVSREHLPIITAADRLSSAGADLLEGLLALTSAPSKPLAERLAGLAPHEVNLITDRLLSRARAATSWGTPSILWALLTVTERTGEHVERVARFLRETPPAQRTAAIVPVLADKPWAQAALSAWAGETGTSEPVKKAIANLSKKAAN